MTRIKNAYKLNKKDKVGFQCWLLKNGLSESQFAKKCGVSQQYVSKVINGNCSITPNVVEIFKKGGYSLKPISNKEEE